MRILKTTLYEIHFNQVPYSPLLFESISKRGLAFPIKVKVVEGKYFCVDGHKRLSCLSHLSTSKYANNIPIIITDSDYTRSNDCWRGRNTH